MSVKNYNIVTANLKAFADNHLEVKRFKASYLSNIEMFSREDRTFPILYVTPSSIQNKRYTNTYSFTIICLDKINDDKNNEIAILTSTEQILRDLSIWVKESLNGLELENEPVLIPLENYLFDGFIGWQATYDLTGPAFSTDCIIPFVQDFINDYPDGQCDAFYRTKYLTCETLSGCTIIQGMQSDIAKTITGATQNGTSIPVVNKTIALLDTFATGLTFNNNVLTLKQNNNQADLVTILTPFSSITASTLVVNTISATTYQGNLVTSISASTGLSASSAIGAVTLINTAPDQTVTITGGTNVTVTGNYPNFGISSIDNDRYITGGTVTRNTNQSTLIFGTNSGTTFNVGPIVDTFVTGGTVSRVGPQSSLIFGNNSGNTFTVASLFDTFISGGTVSRIGNLSTLNLVNNSGNTVSVASLFDTFVTGATYNSNTGTLLYTNNSGNTFTVSGLYTNANDIRVTGGTVTRASNLSSLIFTNNTGGTFTVASLFDTITTGATLSGGVATFTNNSGNTFTLSGFPDAFTTGFTYDNSNNISLQRNQGQSPLVVNVSIMSGLTITSTTTGLTVTSNTITTSSLTASTVSINQTISGGTGTALIQRGLEVNIVDNSLGTRSIRGIDSSITNAQLIFTNSSSIAATNNQFTSPSLFVNRTGSSGNSNVGFMSSGVFQSGIQYATTGDLRVGGFAAGGNFVAFWVNNAEAARINTSNNLLVGTTIDTSNKLVVSGSSRFINNSLSATTPQSIVLITGDTGTGTGTTSGTFRALEVNINDVSTLGSKQIRGLDVNIGGVGQLIFNTQGTTSLTTALSTPSLIVNRIGSSGVSRIGFAGTFQGVPNMTTGIQWNTSGQFTVGSLLADGAYTSINANGAEVIRIAGTSSSFNTTNATAKVVIAGSTTAASSASLKFLSGATMTTPEAGAWEFDGVSSYFTPVATRLRNVLTDNTIPSNGQIPIGNGSNYTNATLSAGTGISITNGSGTVTIANTKTYYNGSFSQVGAATTTFTVTIGTTQANSTYNVQVTPTAVLSAALFYVTNKTTTTFDVTYLAGLTGTVTFDWLVTP